MRKIRVLVVDDSRVFRQLLVEGLSRDSYLEVVATAGDAYEARDAILKYRPDVMTLDVELPRMNGIEFLRRLLPQYAIPVVVISSRKDAILDALSAGAVDFVNKPVLDKPADIERFIRMDVAVKVKIASTAKLGHLKHPIQQEKVESTSANYAGKVIAIGASTGGTEAIYEVVKKLEPNIPGVVIVQHMPPGFTTMFAERLNNQCRVRVKEAKTGDYIMHGQVLIAPGDAHMRVVKVGQDYQVECKPGDKVSGHCPSVDVLFDSVAKSVGKNAIGVLLTGMGADGANGLLAMRKAGAVTIGQDEASCVVYGMPHVAYEIGAVMYQVSLENVAGKLYNILNTPNKAPVSNV